ncbi:aldehyde dehydrogenase (NADP(+)) [Verrucomicrobiaceae bacterium 227]
MITLNGHSFIGNSRGGDTSKTFQATNPATGSSLEPAYHAATETEVSKAVSLAADAFLPYSLISSGKRAEFLRTIAENIEALTEEIQPRMTAESGLPEARCRMELGRTCGQLRLFAGLIEDGNWLDARIDTAQPERAPMPKPDIRSMQRPRGPVAVFCASNFPLAFSVAGGDTASALAAGCPVVVRAHSAHPGTAEYVAGAVQQAVISCGLPEGTFSMIFDDGIALGAQLVQDPGIKAVGFTGSRSGGRALMDLAAARHEPIPVYAEMSSINPIFILPGAMAERGEEIAKNLVGSVTVGAGQFCTCPGLVFAPSSEAFDQALSVGFSQSPTATMLHKGICANYAQGIEKLETQPGVEAIAKVNSVKKDCLAGPAIFKTTHDQFIANPALSNEVFGPSSLIVDYPNSDDLLTAAACLEGQLTATVHGTEADLAGATDLLNLLAQKAGRVIINGFPTGVEVCHSIVHGGPYPATSDSGSTSVGTGAITRFTRSVSWQSFPESALPDELKSNNPRSITRLVNGKLTTEPIA